MVVVLVTDVTQLIPITRCFAFSHLVSYVVS